MCSLSHLGVSSTRRAAATCHDGGLDCCVDLPRGSLRRHGGLPCLYRRRRSRQRSLVLLRPPSGRLDADSWHADGQKLDVLVGGQPSADRGPSARPGCLQHAVGLMRPFDWKSYEEPTAFDDDWVQRSNPGKSEQEKRAYRSFEKRISKRNWVATIDEAVCVVVSSNVQTLKFNFFGAHLRAYPKSAISQTSQMVWIGRCIWSVCSQMGPRDPTPMGPSDPPYPRVP